METEGLLPDSEVPTVAPYPKPLELSQRRF
jgi:hypothetical protein